MMPEKTAIPSFILLLAGGLGKGAEGEEAGNEGNPYGRRRRIIGEKS